MHALYLVSVWLHILAATLWIGGMFFLVLVVVPYLRKGDRAKAAALMRDTGGRFRDIGWMCFVTVLLTGTFNLWMRGVRMSSFADPAWRASVFGKAVELKLAVFTVVLLMSAAHDFVLGPKATRAIVADPRSKEAESLRRTASIMGRVNAVLALLLVAIGVVIVRGWPG